MIVESAPVGVLDNSDARVEAALDSTLESCDDKTLETAGLVAVAATLESWELKEEAKVDSAPDALDVADASLLVAPDVAD